MKKIVNFKESPFLIVKRVLGRLRLEIKVVCQIFAKTTETFKPFVVS